MITKLDDLINLVATGKIDKVHAEDCKIGTRTAEATVYQVPTFNLIRVDIKLKVQRPKIVREVASTKKEKKTDNERQT